MGKPQTVVIRLKNVGPFSDAYIELRNLTIIIGRNSVGKSLLLSLLWSLVSTLASKPEVRDIREVKKAVETGLEKRLRQVFGVSPRELVRIGEASAQIDVHGVRITLTDSISVELDGNFSTDGMLGSGGAVFLSSNRICTSEFALHTGRLSESAKRLLRDVGAELETQQGKLYVKTWSGKKLELAHAPSGIRGVAAAVSALSSEAARFVFIEEPEAHLHPAAQRLLMRVVAEAVNSGKFVAMTTHSDYIISELNNLITLSNAKDAAKRLGYRDAEVIKPEMVAAYLVKAEDSQAVVERLEADYAGIPEDEFTKVVEEILEARNELY
jgi:predicted ATPase